MRRRNRRQRALMVAMKPRRPRTMRQILASLRRAPARFFAGLGRDQAAAEVAASMRALIRREIEAFGLDEDAEQVSAEEGS